MAKKSSSGLQSSAGLMRYYEADKKSIKIPPQAILIFGIAVVVIVLAASFMYGKWPIVH